MIPSAKPRLLLAAALFALAAPACAGEDFIGMPGIWQTTLTTHTGGSKKPSVKSGTHCIDETIAETDPWTAFAPQPEQAGDSCKRIFQGRTATSLKWRIKCTGTAPLTSSGTLVFDSATHFTGKIDETLQSNGKTVHRAIDIEGSHEAACTSPLD